MADMRQVSSASRNTVPDFKHYDYVNPDAPKGGTLNQTSEGSFDSLNPYVVQGSTGLRTWGIGRRPALRYIDEPIP